uniref:LIM zinc-binding domain-containing protein n=1 Tax=Poecilia latipinna TaxID=48699 RepID=A0A3B3V7H7_9TELE
MVKVGLLLVLIICPFVCFAAERVTSLGKDWHRPCLKCEKCNKTLSAGSHAEVERPNYTTLIGVGGERFGRGGAESHTYK